jgi:hypothetical protein
MNSVLSSGRPLMSFATSQCCGGQQAVGCCVNVEVWQHVHHPLVVKGCLQMCLHGWETVMCCSTCAAEHEESKDYCGQVKRVPA